MNYDCPELTNQLNEIRHMLKAHHEALERLEKMQAVVTGLRAELDSQRAIVARIRYESRVVSAPEPDNDVVNG